MSGAKLQATAGLLALLLLLLPLLLLPLLPLLLLPLLLLPLLPLPLLLAPSNHLYVLAVSPYLVIGTAVTAKCG
jgi:hypothetical protein